MGDAKLHRLVGKVRFLIAFECAAEAVQSENKSFLPGSLGRCVARSADVLTRRASREPVEALMNPAALIAMLAAVNNGWAFAAFVLLLAVSLYFGRRDAP